MIKPVGIFVVLIKCFIFGTMSSKHNRYFCQNSGAVLFVILWRTPMPSSNVKFIKDANDIKERGQCASENGTRKIEDMFCIELFLCRKRNTFG